MKMPQVSLCLLAGAFFLIANPAIAYEEVDVSNGGIIKGTVTYNGSVPTRTIVPTKDQTVCGKIRKEPAIRVNADKGVADAVIYLQKVASGKSWPADAPEPVLDQKDCRFVPHVQVVPVGKLAILNSDPVLHNTHGFYGRRTAFNLALPNKGQRIETELKRPGTVRIECDAHGWMLGWVYVVDNPYFAVTGEDGTFEISDVPPGTYTLAVDHEHTGSMTLSVEVKAGETAEVPIELKK